MNGILLVLRLQRCVLTTTAEVHTHLVMNLLQERERPEFVMAIKKKIKDYPPEKKQRFSDASTGFLSSELELDHENIGLSLGLQSADSFTCNLNYRREICNKRCKRNAFSTVIQPCDETCDSLVVLYFVTICS